MVKYFNLIFQIEHYLRVQHNGVKIEYRKNTENTEKLGTARHIEDEIIH